MKTIRASILAIAGMGLVACGGMSQEDIQDALKTAEPPTSTLNYKVGETWTAKKKVVAKGTQALPATSRMEYKYENGKAEPCEFNIAHTGSANCGSVQATISVETTEYASKVSEKSDTAVTKTAGFVVIETAKVNLNVQKFYPVTGTQETGNFPVDSVLTSLYTLAELNNFVVRIDGESDVGASQTLFPSHPSNRRTYTDDTGMSWAFTSGTNVVLASRTVAALAATVATSQVSGQGIAALKAKCFSRQPAPGAPNTETVIDLHGDCAGWIQLESDLRVAIGLDLKLRETIHSVMISFTDWGVRDTAGVLQGQFPNSNGGDTVILYDAIEEDTTYEVTDVTF